MRDIQVGGFWHTKYIQHDLPLSGSSQAAILDQDREAQKAQPKLPKCIPTSTMSSVITRNVVHIYHLISIPSFRAAEDMI